MGRLFKFKCNACGNRFSAEKGFGGGLSGDIYADVVCAEHGIHGAKTGVNLKEGGSIASIQNLKAFPCAACGAQSPLWDQKSCPECGSEDLDETGYLLYD